MLWSWRPGGHGVNVTRLQGEDQRETKGFDSGEIRLDNLCTTEN